MPRYYFHVFFGVFFFVSVGLECPTLDEAKKQAEITAGAMLRDQGLKVWKTRRYYMFVANEKNETCLKLAFDVEDLTLLLGVCSLVWWCCWLLWRASVNRYIK